MHIAYLTLSPIVGSALWLIIIWIRGGKSARARRFKPRTITQERGIFIALPMVASVASLLCPTTALALLAEMSQEPLKTAIIPILLLLAGTIIVVIVVPIFWSMLDVFLPYPRWMVPKWMYDESFGHPFSFKLRGVKRDPNAPEPPLF